MNEIDELFERALRLTQAFPNNYGMASVVVRWNPYRSGWLAEANWADDTYILIKSARTFAKEALLDLIRQLEDPTLATIWRESEILKGSE